MRESRTPGSVRGALSNERPYRDSRESLKVSGADVVGLTEGNMDGRVIASARPTRRGQRNWHVRKLFVREPGDLSPIRGACVAGSRREGEEP